MMRKLTLTVWSRLAGRNSPPGTIPLLLFALCDFCDLATLIVLDSAAWTEDYPRLNVFQRFTLSAYFGEFGPSPGGDSDDGNASHRDRLSAECAELEMPSYTDHEPTAVRKMREYFAKARPELRNRRHREQTQHSFPRL